MRQNQFGRSMIEMLGVLAIIGVLSVGGIAGYSKAMIKWQINQQIDVISQLLNTMIQYRESFGKDLQKGTSYLNLMPLLASTGNMPDILTEYPQKLLGITWYQDRFGFLYNVAYMKTSYNANGSYGESSINIWLPKSGSLLTQASYEFCIAALNFAKTNTQDVWRASVWNYYTAGKRANFDYGEITQLTATQISNACRPCSGTDTNCMVYLYLKMD